MRNDGLTKSFYAEGTLEGRKLVTFGAGKLTVKQATAASDALIGVTTQIGSETNGRVDVIFAGITEANAGGTIAKGDVLTSDASANVVKASQAADRVIGIALEDAVAGDYVSILIAQG